MRASERMWAVMQWNEFNNNKEYEIHITHMSVRGEFRSLSLEQVDTNECLFRTQSKYLNGTTHFDIFYSTE